MVYILLKINLFKNKFVGDGAGVGKGRIIATIIYENYLLGRKRAVWLSVSSDLKFDAERDLKDIGASHIDVYSLNKLKYAKINGVENNHIKKGVIFSTYASLIGECRSAQNLTYSSRLKQVLQWCGKVKLFIFFIFYKKLLKKSNLINYF